MSFNERVINLAKKMGVQPFALKHLLYSIYGRGENYNPVAMLETIENQYM